MFRNVLGDLEKLVENMEGLRRCEIKKRYLWKVVWHFIVENFEYAMNRGFKLWSWLQFCCNVWHLGKWRTGSSHSYGVVLCWVWYMEHGVVFTLVSFTNVPRNNVRFVWQDFSFFCDCIMPYATGLFGRNVDGDGPPKMDWWCIPGGVLTVCLKVGWWLECGGRLRSETFWIQSRI